MTLIIGVSIVVPIVVALLFTFPAGKTTNLGWIGHLPMVNASLNSVTALLLILGRVSIFQKKEAAHRKFMIAAFAVSALFLVSYLIYHSSAEPTRFGGEGLIKPVYYFLLITHIVLAAIVLPMILFSIYFGITNKRRQHKKLVRFTFPIWLYVAVSGVLVYLLLSPYYTS